MINTKYITNNNKEALINDANMSFGGEEHIHSLVSDVSGQAHNSPLPIPKPLIDAKQNDSVQKWDPNEDIDPYLVAEYDYNDRASLISFGSGKKTGTVFSGCINLSNTVLGAGILSLPYAVSQTGYVLGMILFVLFAMLTFGALHLNMAMTRCVPNASYYAFAEAINRPATKLIIDIAVIIAMVSSATSYLIIIGDVMPDFCTHFWPGTDHSDGSIFAIGAYKVGQREFWTFVFLLVFILPTVSFKRMDLLKYTSLFAIFCFTFITIVMLLYMGLVTWDECKGIDHDDCKGDVMAFLDLSKAKNWLVFLKVTPFYLLAFGCAQNTLPISNEMKNRSLMRLNLVLINMLCFVVAVYCLVGNAGYFTYGDKIEADVLKKYPKNGITACVRLSISIAVAFSYPLVLFPARKSLCLLVWGHEPQRLSKLRYHGVTYFIVVVTVVYALSAQNIGIVFQLAGSTAYPIKEYIFPAYTYYMLTHDILDRDRFGKAKKKFAACLFVFGCCLIPFCLTLVFVDV